MTRYFIEVSYKGSRFAGFQVQKNAHTVQQELQDAMAVYFRAPVMLTGSSRTDAGVHALQNFFHFDFDGTVDPLCVYNLNALLGDDVAVKSLRAVNEDAHCRFDAISRRYCYRIYRHKDPFLRDVAYHFPYSVDFSALRAAAALVLRYQDFAAFAKRNSQAKTTICTVFESDWEEVNGCFQYRVRANRFLRGMVRGLVGTMLQVGRGRMRLDDFEQLVAGGSSLRADFSVPGRGLMLEEVAFREGYFG